MQSVEEARHREVPFEMLIMCEEGHLFCFECISRYLEDRLIVTAAELKACEKKAANNQHVTKFPKKNGIISCFACNTEGRGGGKCEAQFALSQLRRALPTEQLRQYESLCQRISLAEAGFAVSVCPFCSSVEASDTDVTSCKLRLLTMVRTATRGRAFVMLREGLSAVFIFHMMGLLPESIISPKVVNALFVALVVVIVIGQSRSMSSNQTHQTKRCQNPNCQVLRCIRCNNEAHDLGTPCQISKTNVSPTEEGLRIFVETAMAQALVRTCPNCSCQFHKLDGCNKMTCVCGYKMCYICRAEIHDYSHFCPHFRPYGGVCQQCTRCDLYGNGDDEALIRRTGRETIANFFHMYPHLVGIVPRPTQVGPYKL